MTLRGVKIKNDKIRKPSLGGYKCIFTNTIYHNAASQTGPLVRYNVANVCSRASQCINIKDNSCQPSINKATQTWREDCYISSETDKYMTAKKYESYDEKVERLDINNKVKKIQRCYRSWQIIKRISKCAMIYREMSKECKNLTDKHTELLKKKNQLSIIQYIFPQFYADFSKIYSLILSVQQSHTDKLQNYFFHGAVVAKNCQILKNTIDMLNATDKHRQCIVKDNKNKQVEKFLTSNCKSVVWSGYKGKFIEMVTLKVQKARETKYLYDNLNKTNCTTEERIELLMQLKTYLKSHNCYYAIDLNNLVDQEIALSTRCFVSFVNINTSSLSNLKARISVAFLYFARHSHECCRNDPDMELHEPNKTINKLLCRYCERLIPRNKFVAHRKTKKLYMCIYCSRLHQNNTVKIDYSPYKYLLNQIRAQELEQNSLSRLLLLIEESDIYLLVNNIWHGHSVVSENNDIFQLRIARFYVDEQWSPWNCILLTEEEMKAHYANRDLQSLYSKDLLGKISLNNCIARTYFKYLVKLKLKYRNSFDSSTIVKE